MEALNATLGAQGQERRHHWAVMVTLGPEALTLAGPRGKVDTGEAARLTPAAGYFGAGRGWGRRLQSHPRCTRAQKVQKGSASGPDPGEDGCHSALGPRDGRPAGVDVTKAQCEMLGAKSMLEGGDTAAFSQPGSPGTGAGGRRRWQAGCRLLGRLWVPSRSPPLGIYNIEAEKEEVC